jgi:hypothetical protein
MRKTGGILMAVLIATCGAIASQHAAAATLEGLLMPGPLSQAHAKLEADCGNCHNRTDRTQQRALCLDCHKDVAADIGERRGFHGLRTEVASAQCKACHSDHLGRNARIVAAPTQEFDHARTDFRLDGAHRGAACSSCHVAGKRFREAPSRCVDCHEKQEPHQRKLGTDCASCHDTTRWSAMHFDHDKTRFALQSRHAEIPCAACHAGNRWKNTPAGCASCHAPDDVHRGERGNACADCHTQKSWSDTRFDHEKETGFALNGAHKTAVCQSCHRSGRFQDKLPKDCAGCHAAIDMHAGRMGTKCEACHDVSHWKPADFEHERDSKFALLGAHAKLGCHSCHVSDVTKQKPGRECIACHRAQDVHAGTLGAACETCHASESWRAGIRFDHDLTDFPLLGQHATVPCASCHVSHQFGKLQQECGSCHRADDVHKGSLGKDCARCHSPNAWNVWQFDHQKESGFALSGAHARLQCNGCHRRPPGEVRLGRDCASCHSTDDVHLGQFGRRCDSCHSTISFHRARPQ